MNSKTVNWTRITEASDQQIIQWAESQDWSQRMAQCNQDPEWHAEGDVWTHTKMVCAQLHRLPEWHQLPRTTQLTLLLTAIFHDAGKPEVTVLDELTGRIRSPKHAERGSRIARNILTRIGCNIAIREAICRLVLFHGRPMYLSEKADSDRELIKLSWLVNHRQLYLFALADYRGRVCETKDRGEEMLALWPEVAEENNCLDQPYPFLNSHARFLFHRNRLDNLHYQPHEDFRCQMTIVCGLPGAGKDTWLQTKRSWLPVVSLDAIRRRLGISPTVNQGTVVQAAKAKCREYLRNETNFAFNATNITRQVRKRWIDLAADYGAKVEIVYLEPNWEQLLMQNRQREANVPQAIMNQLLDKLDPPSWTECHELCYPTFPTEAH